MTLGEWLAANGVTQNAFARHIGVTQGLISHIVRKGTNSYRTALKIREATVGAVSLDDLAPTDLDSQSAKTTEAVE
jgi:DNA-binding transcriptional regulator YdaS (Cro superfamily)